MDKTISPLPRAGTSRHSISRPCADIGMAGLVSPAIRPVRGGMVVWPWWSERQATRRGHPGGAARALGIALTDHATVLARAKAAVARIEAGMAWAQSTGVLHEFNQEYRRRRLEAQGRGHRFMNNAQWRGGGAR
jgi:hypothetical protein